ncbi:unnamed protein product [Bemisia tabaci]|uniref:Uncharacterized protein n=1 Tax=Bemisia tabaci TaxID=7038 RepID=A0A9P0AN94_BEMTA|nr:unnamed protein product [Bemisia tabaci]
MHVTNVASCSLCIMRIDQGQDQDYPADSASGGGGSQTNNTPVLWYPGGRLNPMPLYNGQTLLLQQDPCLLFRENFRQINIQRRRRCRIAAMRMNNQTIRNTQVCPRVVNGQCVPFTNGTHGACHAIVRHGKKAYTFVLLSDCLLNGGGNNGTSAGGGNNGTMGAATSGAGGQPTPPPTAGG